MYYESIQKLNNKYGDNIFFLEIGAMDGIQHDPLYQHIIQNNWSGIFVEPVKDMFIKLQINYISKNKLKFENSAITDKDGNSLIYRIPIEKVNVECPHWADGISTINPEKGIIYQSEILKSNAITEYIETITVKTLVEKYKISNIDILQIDAEGYDAFIFYELWNYGFKPKIIRIEIAHMENESLNNILELLKINNYLTENDSQDLTAVSLKEIN